VLAGEFDAVVALLGGCNGAAEGPPPDSNLFFSGNSAIRGEAPISPWEGSKTLSDATPEPFPLRNDLGDSERSKYLRFP